MKTRILITLTLLSCGTAATSYAQAGYAAQPQASVTLPATGGVLKGDGAGGAVVALPGTDFATVAQASHSGGVVGTASFNAVSGSISKLVNDGVITGVSSSGTGRYSINLSGQPDANYVALASLGGNGSDNTWTYDIPVADKKTSSFTLEVRLNGSKSDGSDNIQVVVMRLSQ